MKFQGFAKNWSL